jgi:hypothetical protein
VYGAVGADKEDALFQVPELAGRVVGDEDLLRGHRVRRKECPQYEEQPRSVFTVNPRSRRVLVSPLENAKK